ncbi:hypothetical protein GCM10009579_70710 [Streptomyces javensis]|uniref:Uncharacterized protein n=1 Tax=Streptomyces javensis TaxID=114698 RepID=A0ABN1X9L7_9ACTN
MLVRSRTRWRRIVSSAATGLIAVTGLLGAVAAPAHAAPETAVGAVTSFTYTSERGDWVGRGETGSYAAPTDTLKAVGTAEYLTVQVSTGALRSWTIELAAPKGETLHPGVYREAERAGSRTGRAPGLDVSGLGRGCNEVYGQFAIDQIETDASGAVTMLDATFTQRCQEAAPALNGTVKINAHPLSYGYTSDEGDPLGGGRSDVHTGSTSLFTLAGTGVGHIDVGVSGKRQNWSVTMAAPGGEAVEVGRTYQTTRLGLDGTAALDVSGPGGACNASRGEFTITELSHDAAGDIDAFAATFIQHCEGVEPALHGTIHYLV